MFVEPMRVESRRVDESIVRCKIDVSFGLCHDCEIQLIAAFHKWINVHALIFAKFYKGILSLVLALMN